MITCYLSLHSPLLLLCHLCPCFALQAGMAEVWKQLAAAWKDILPEEKAVFEAHAKVGAGWAAV